jgi:hypothetical protein
MKQSDKENSTENAAALKPLSEAEAAQVWGGAAAGPYMRICKPGQRANPRKI